MVYVLIVLIGVVYCNAVVYWPTLWALIIFDPCFCICAVLEMDRNKFHMSIS